MSDEQFTRSYQMHKNSVYAVIFHYVRNDADASELLQETFMRLYTNEKPFDSDEHEKAWLLRVAINLSKNHLRRMKFNAYSEIDENIPAPIQEDYSDLLRAVHELPEKYRIPIHLYYYEDYSVREIAGLLGILEATVKTRLNRARSMLKKKLGKEYAVA